MVPRLNRAYKTLLYLLFFPIATGTVGELLKFHVSLQIFYIIKFDIFI